MTRRHYYWWDNDKNTGWHLCRVPVDEGFNSDQFEALYMEIVDWIYANVDHCQRHARWRWQDDDILVRFRYERDFLVFSLRWT